MRFIATLTRGRIATELREHIADYIASFGDGTIAISIKTYKPQRSLDQNAFLHAEPFPKLAAKWGESIARTKLICMGEFWGWEPCQIGTIRVFLPVKAHTADMTRQECTTFIDWLIPWALTEHGVEIDLPDEHQDYEAE